MIIYIKLGKIRGLSIELQKEYGLNPLFQKNTFHYETIFDIPYGQIIYTSGKWYPFKKKGKKTLGLKPGGKKSLPLRRPSNVNRQDHNATKRSSGADRN